jgi:hypothetical protein
VAPAAAVLIPGREPLNSTTGSYSNMKRLFLLITTLCLLGFSPAGATTQHSLNTNAPYYQSGISISMNFPYGGEVYYMTITNNADIFIYLDFYSGSSSVYIDDQSSHVGHWVNAENYWEYVYVNLDYLPSGTYEVSGSGRGGHWLNGMDSYMSVNVY